MSSLPMLFSLNAKGQVRHIVDSHVMWYFLCGRQLPPNQPRSRDLSFLLHKSAKLRHGQNYRTHILNQSFPNITRQQSSTFSYHITAFFSYKIFFLRLHGAEIFLGSRQLRCYSRMSQNFIKPECSLLCSQGTSTGPYHEPDQSSAHHLIISL
jgi:hypothetical protein